MSESIKLPVSPEGIIQMQGVNKWYGQFHVLKDIAASYNVLDQSLHCCGIVKQVMPPPAIPFA